MTVFKNRTFQLQYAEFGKVFRRDSRGAYEYAVLDRSDDNTASDMMNFYFKEVALFGEKNNSPFISKQSGVGNVSVALISWDNTRYVYLQMQSRREDEFVENVKPRTHRFFNQARLIQISNKDIQECFQQKIGLFSTLLYQNPEYPSANRLKDYLEPEQGSVRESNIGGKGISIRQEDNSFLAGIVNAVYGESITQLLVDGKAPLRLARPLVFIKPGLTLAEKLQIIDAVQYLLIPTVGVITFTLDYITDRPALLYLFDELVDGGYVEDSKIVTEDELTNSQLQDYFGALQSLSPDELYHETLSFYLRQDVAPEWGVRLFRLIETEFSFSTKEELELIRNTQEYVTDAHWTKIIQRRYSEDAKYRLLLPLLPIQFRIKSLKKILEEKGKNLAIYAPYHMAAIQGAKKNNEMKEQLQEILIEVIRNSKPDDLVKLSDDIRVPIYEELIHIAYMGREDKSSIHQEKLRFRKSNTTDTQGQLVLQALIARGENAFFECMNLFQSMDDIHHFLIDLTLDGLEKEWCAWDFETTLMFWNSIHHKTTDNFLGILRFLLRNPIKYSELVRYPSEFQGFLLEGSALLRELYGLKFSPERIDGVDKHQNSLLGGLSSLLHKRDIILLREACIEVSQPLAAENIRFASWWLTDELVYTSTESFINDYADILSRYRNSFQRDNFGISTQSLFLLSGGSLGGNLSLIDCCMKSDVESHRDVLDEELLKAVLQIWILQEISIPTKDINYLIEKLPDEKSNIALTKIVLNARREQVATVVQLEAHQALQWLSATKQNRMSYIVDSSDLLFERLQGLKKPSLELIRYMLIDDPGAYPLRGGWREYVNKIKRVYERYWKVSLHDSFVEDYIALAVQLMDFPGIGSKYRPVIKKIVEFRYINQSTDSIRDEEILKGLLDLTYENEVPMQDFQRRIDYILLQFLRRPDLANLLGNLELSTIRELSNYAYMKKESNLIDLSITELLDNEGHRRNLDSIHLGTSDSETFLEGPDIKDTRTQLKTGERRLQNHPAKVIGRWASVMKAKITLFEIFLSMVLFLVAIIIILEAWIVIDQTAFDKVWQFIRSFLLH